MSRDAAVHCLMGLLMLHLTALLQFSNAGKVSSQIQAMALDGASRSLMQSLAPRYQKPYNICTSDWAPMVTCADIESPDDYGGFQVQLWREIAADLGWADSDWFLSCVGWTDMIDDLVSPTGNCSFAPAGVEVSLENIVAGLKFSWPIYKSGFRVLIASHVQDEGLWAFAQAFDWSVWVVLGATAVVVSILVTAAEALTYGNRANRKGLRGWSWYSMGKMVQVHTHVGDPKTWASRLLVLGYAFLVLIMVHLFTATTASKLTMQRLANDITGKQDLPGKKVMSWEPYVPLLRKYSIDATAMRWDTDADTLVMLDNLRSNKYKALILDNPVVQHFAAVAEHCDLFPVGEAFETFNLAIAFPPDAPTALSEMVSASIVRLQTTQGILDKLENKYIRGGDGHAACTNAFQDLSSGGHSGNPQINMLQVAGLWYIMLITLAIAVLVTLTKIAYRHPAARRCCGLRRVHPAAAAAQTAGGSRGSSRDDAAAVNDAAQAPSSDCITEVAFVADAGDITCCTGKGGSGEEAHVALCCRAGTVSAARQPAVLAVSAADELPLLQQHEASVAPPVPEAEEDQVLKL